MKSFGILITFLFLTCSSFAQQKTASMAEKKTGNRSEAEWKEALTAEQYNVCRLGGTEMPGSGKYDKFYEKGYYKCVACGNHLFDSGTKFDSGSGWPSFYDAHNKKGLVFRTDNSHNMNRTEVICGQCESHLGHVFNDGPSPTGLRYCINSLALEFVPDKK